MNRLSQKAKPEAAPNVAAAKEILPSPTRRWRARVFQFYLVAATAAFGVLFVLASRFSYFPVDVTISRGVQSINTVGFSSLMWAVSVLGYAPQEFLMMGAAIVFLWVVGLRWEAVTVLLAGPGVTVLGALTKVVVHRPRPGADLVNVVQQLNDSSFPSGHVLMYSAFFGFLFFLTYSLLKPSLARAGVLALLGSLVALVGVSRIYIGAHWASDVAGAYLLGSLWLTFSVVVYRWGKTRYFVRQPLAPDKPESAKLPPTATT